MVGYGLDCDLRRARWCRSSSLRCCAARIVISTAISRLRPLPGGGCPTLATEESWNARGILNYNGLARIFDASPWSGGVTWSMVDGDDKRGTPCHRRVDTFVWSATIMTGTLTRASSHLLSLVIAVVFIGCGGHHSGDGAPSDGVVDTDGNGGCGLTTCASQNATCGPVGDGGTYGSAMTGSSSARDFSRGCGAAAGGPPFAGEEGEGMKLCWRRTDLNQPSA